MSEWAFFLPVDMRDSAVGAGSKPCCASGRGRFGRGAIWSVMPGRVDRQGAAAGEPDAQVVLPVCR